VSPHSPSLCSDHLIRISDLINRYRDLLSSAMDVYLSTVSKGLVLS
jgi:Mg2+ and Co2+ transporter CorA